MGSDKTMGSIIVGLVLSFVASTLLWALVATPRIFNSGIRAHERGEYVVDRHTLPDGEIVVTIVKVKARDRD